MTCIGANGCQSNPIAPSGPQLGLIPSPGAPRLKSLLLLNAPPSIHQVQVSFATGSAGGAFIGIALLRSAAPALGAATASATTEAPARRAIRRLWLLCCILFIPAVNLIQL